ncbi:uncharacterized protein SCHCODRAFT_02608964 [Schizophyllum commune H4-8]|uniref:uncharacterized protein n=1 Tax=Schizophyllum commune (strain H4-8 / FGSC 9210) TaxID=578458 RepID=UPI002160D206|nr:uncharacterized protein SCHCODRAFT_02608964 [Schizophyllum commune H4-8]KAI5900866.1 hypothetical protein SCHCODRAFT_02608964 [Schizophyllum commune H4-8]
MTTVESRLVGALLHQTRLFERDETHVVFRGTSPAGFPRELVPAGIHHRRITCVLYSSSSPLQITATRTSTRSMVASSPIYRPQPRHNLLWS